MENSEEQLADPQISQTVEQMTEHVAFAKWLTSQEMLSIW